MNNWDKLAICGLPSHTRILNHNQRLSWLDYVKIQVVTFGNYKFGKEFFKKKLLILHLHEIYIIQLNLSLINYANHFD